MFLCGLLKNNPNRGRRFSRIFTVERNGQNVVLPGYFENHLHSDGIDSMNVFVNVFVNM